MIIVRGFVVWAFSCLLLLTTFYLFVLFGWPGNPNACTQTIPDSCFCESFALHDIKSGAPGVRQAINTWSNLYAVLSSFLVALFIYRDRIKYSRRRAPNLMGSTTLVPDLFIFAVLFLGLGSLWFHGSLTVWGGILDGMSMYVFAAFLVFYTLRRSYYPSAVFFWTAYLTTVGVFTYLHTLFPPLINILILVAAYLLVEIHVWKRSGQFLQGKRLTQYLWLAAATSILLASFFWWASQTGHFMCKPESFFQPHGLLWHPLAGLMAVLMYFYWRAADDRN